MECFKIVNDLIKTDTLHENINSVRIFIEKKRFFTLLYNKARIQVQMNFIQIDRHVLQVVKNYSYGSHLMTEYWRTFWRIIHISNVKWSLSIKHYFQSISNVSFINV